MQTVDFYLYSIKNRRTGKQVAAGVFNDIYGNEIVYINDEDNAALESNKYPYERKWQGRYLDIDESIYDVETKSISVPYNEIAHLLRSYTYPDE